MKLFKRLLFTLLLLFLLFVLLFIYINLRTAKEILPEVSLNYGSEVDHQDRKWWESTTVYQIYPRSYQDSDGDGIGDIPGIINRLDYIKDLGFETIWFSPFFVSPQKDFGYDVSDYYLPDPVYGDSILVDSLISEVHRRDMKIVFDLVLNHTSDEHPWFIESRTNRDNPKSDWYVWRDGMDSDPPNNWHNALGTNGWHYDEARDQWYFSAFLPFQPDLNWRNPEVKTAMFDVVRHWLDKGVDGFRLDIFNFILEDESFLDNPRTLRYLPTEDLTTALGQVRKYTMNHPDNFTLAKEMRQVLDAYSPPRFMVGEVFGNHLTLKKFLGEANDGLNLVFLFDISHFQWNAQFFRDKIETFEAFYPYPYQPTYVFSNHDRYRSISLLDDDEQKAKCLALMQMTLRGVPFTYQGEEIGMHTANISNDKALDPLPEAFNWLPSIIRKNVPLIFNRDNCRTPMQWNGNPNAGFSSDKAYTWLPIQGNASIINVAEQAEKKYSILNVYKNLLALRKSDVCLKWGSLRILEASWVSKDLLAYERIYHDQKRLLVINFSEETKEIPGAGSLLYATTTIQPQNGTILLEPHSGIILRLD